MCSFGSNQSAPTTQFSTQTTSANPQAQAMYGAAWQRAQQVGDRPFQPYSYDPNAFVAPMNSTQLTAVNNIYGQQNVGQPYYQAAPGMAYASGNTSAAGLAPAYMSPYLNNVAASTMGWLNQQQGMERNQLAGQIAKNGQWGNDRSGIERATLAGQQNLATAKTISDLYNTGYNSALGAAQTDLKRQLDASQLLGGQGLQGAQALLGAGTVGQQTQQAGLTALVDQYLRQQQYPFQVAQFLSSTAAGLGPGYGGTTSGYQSSQQPLSFFGNPLSDPSLKVGPDGGEEPEVIGQTNDGQDIYRYRLVDPDTGKLGPVQIGLMADEVEQRRPDAIGDYKGFRTVDYGKATDDAARLGGGVTGRGDYADGGSIDDLLRSHEAMYQGLGKMPPGIVPQSQMVTAKLDAPQLSFMAPERREPYGVGAAAKDALGLIESGKGLYKETKEPLAWLAKAAQVGATGKGILPEQYASGGGIYAEDPEATQGPESAQMPVAKLDAPQLSFASDEKGKNASGIGDMVKTAAGLAGTAKTLWDIGSTVGPMVMALSDRRLKTGVRPHYEGGGRLKSSDLYDYLLSKEADPREATMLTSGADAESSFNPSAVHDKGTGYGLWGHRQDRYDAMKKFTGEERPGWQKQADFALDELRHRPEHKMVMTAKTPEELTRAQMFYERPAGFTPQNPEAGSQYGRRLETTKGLGLGTALALAAPERQPANEAVAAIEKATSRGVMPPQAASRGVMPANDDSSAPQGLSGFVRGTPASGLGEKALDFATSERFLVPLLTGLGAMASSGSRYLAPAVLQGLGAGAQSYMGTQKAQADIAKAQEDVRTQAAETAARQKMAPKIAIETKKLQAELYEKQWVPNVGWMVYDKSQPYATPTRISDADGNPLPGAEKFASAPTSGEAPSGSPAPVPGSSSPASTPSGAPEGKKVVKEPTVGSALDWTPVVSAPKDTRIPGSLNMALSGDLPKQQESARAEIDGLRKRAQSAYDQQYRLDEMQRQFANLPESGFLQPGPGADARTNLAKTLNEVTTMLGGKPVFDPNEVASAETLAKDATRLGFATANALGHEPGFIVQQAVAANPSMNNSPMAFRRIIAGLKEATNYEQARLQFMEDYSARYSTLAGADAAFKKLNPPEAFARRAVLSTIDPEDLAYLRKLPRAQVKKQEGVIDKEYGKGTTAILLGAK